MTDTEAVYAALVVTTNYEHGERKSITVRDAPTYVAWSLDALAAWQAERSPYISIDGDLITIHADNGDFRYTITERDEFVARSRRWRDGD